MSDPAARARRGPAPVRRGRSHHDHLCRLRLSETACSGGEKRRVLAASNALDYDPDLPDDPVPVRPENIARKQVAFARAFRQLLSRKVVPRARRIRFRLAAVVR